MFEVLDIAKYVIYKHWRSGATITNLKLQKILYYIQGYAFRERNEPAFAGPIYKWPYGPVVPEVYYEYNCYRSLSIPEPDAEVMSGVITRIKSDKNLKVIVDDVVDCTYKYSACDLVNKTHQESPWLEAKDSEIITNSAISLFFNSNNPLEIGEA